jgi:hypothetical protein
VHIVSRVDSERQASAEIEDRLAIALFATMERLDPTGHDDWDALSDADKEYYRVCAEAVLVEANA